MTRPWLQNLESGWSDPYPTWTRTRIGNGDLISVAIFSSLTEQLFDKSIDEQMITYQRQATKTFSNRQLKQRNM
jgi:hypothetical protein